MGGPESKRSFAIEYVGTLVSEAVLAFVSAAVIGTSFACSCSRLSPSLKLKIRN